MKIISYLDQLDAAAKQTGVSLECAVEQTPIAYSTIWRWRKMGVEPQLDTARMLLRRMKRMSANT